MSISLVGGVKYYDDSEKDEEELDNNYFPPFPYGTDKYGNRESQTIEIQRAYQTSDEGHTIPPRRRQTAKYGKRNYQTIEIQRS